MLTDNERSLLRRVFQHGPSVFVEEGYSSDAIDAFMKRDDVVLEWNSLQSEFNNQDALFGRSKFIAKRQLSRLAPGAVAILGQALAGPSYVRTLTGEVAVDAKGNYLVRSPEPTSNQVRAAEAVLETLGVDDKKADTTGDEGVRRMFATTQEKALTITNDVNLLTEEERVLSREKIRNAMGALLPALVEAQKKLKSELSRKKGKRKIRKILKGADTVSGDT